MAPDATLYSAGPWRITHGKCSSLHGARPFTMPVAFPGCRECLGLIIRWLILPSLDPMLPGPEASELSQPRMTPQSGRPCPDAVVDKSMGI